MSEERKVETRELETIDVQGKQYVTVNSRIKYFREHFPNWKMLSDIVEITPAEVVTMNGKDLKKERSVIIKAWIENDKGEVVATGMAQEKENSSFINKTSFIENCETSAWGRALANNGIGVDSSVASADELLNAMSNQ